MSNDAGFHWPGGARAAVSLSFDDTRPSQLDYGTPLFDAHGIKATFYASLTSLLARLPDWKKAHASGHEIGNHSLRHMCSGNFTWSRDNALEDYTEERMESELREANGIIRQAIGAAPVTFAYPCGQTFIGRGEACRSYVPVVARNFLAGRGFRAEFVNSPDYCDLAHLGGVDSDMFSFDQYMAWINRALDEGGWIVFVGHDIREKPAFQVSVTGELDRLLGKFKEPGSGIWVDTVAAVSAHVKSKSTR
jgi:hypothetical protein